MAQCLTEPHISIWGSQKPTTDDRGNIDQNTSINREIGDRTEYIRRFSGKARSEEHPPTENGKLNFACPFFKHEPCQFGTCANTVLSKISYVKQHLRRHHYKEFVCQRCSCEFPSNRELDEHLRRSRPCEFSTTRPNSVTPKMVVALSQRMDQSLALHEQWYKIWEIVFPGDKRPVTPYLDPTLGQDINIYQEFLMGHGLNSMVARLGETIIKDQQQLQSLQNIMPYLIREVTEAFTTSYHREASTSGSNTGFRHSAPPEPPLQIYPPVEHAITPTANSSAATTLQEETPEIQIASETEIPSPSTALHGTVPPESDVVAVEAGSSTVGKLPSAIQSHIRREYTRNSLTLETGIEASGHLEERISSEQPGHSQLQCPDALESGTSDAEMGLSNKDSDILTKDGPFQHSLLDTDILTVNPPMPYSTSSTLHPSQSPEQGSPIEGSGLQAEAVHACRGCKWKFATQRELDRHHTAAHIQRVSYRCRCDYLTTRKDNFGRHLRNCKASQKRNEYSCVCGHLSSSRDTILTHVLQCSPRRGRPPKLRNRH